MMSGSYTQNNQNMFNVKALKHDYVLGGKQHKPQLALFG